MRNPRDLRHRVLLADDDAAVREAIRDLLGHEGFTEVLEADTGLAALEILHREAPLLAFSILDVDMPGMSGIEVVRTARREQSALPCILVSGDASRERHVQAMEVGAFSLLSKPIAPDLLRYSVKRLVDHHYGGPPA